MKLSTFQIYYTIFVFIALAAFEHIIIGLFPPLFPYIAKDLAIDVGDLGFISGMNILVTAVSSIYWGYLSGKTKRKRLIIIGTLIWVGSIFLTAISQSFVELLLYQVLTGIGLGCMASIGFSVLTDYIPYRKRGLVLSLWGMAQGLGGIVGSMMASLTTTNTSWRWSFELVGMIGLVLILLYVFITEPKRGGSDPELKAVGSSNQSYDYVIEPKHIKAILLQGSNVYLYIQALFMNIATGSLIWIPTLYIYKIIQQGYEMKTAVIASGFLYAIFQIGGMASVYLGHLGDRVQRKSFKGRAYLTAFFVFFTLPLYICFFAIPMTNLSLPTDGDAIDILISLVQQIILNPWVALLFVLSFIASAFQSANTPNWLALITDVNLPEHRGTAFSIANLFNSIGRTFGNVGVGIILGMIGTRFSEPYNYMITLSILQIFLIPSAICYLKMAKHNVIDIKHVKNTLTNRGRV
ncbi:MFS transporter [Radiobacillus kanasensis]|uniref:MFS transporter n=1 Tax=Radiobacillus kanasensis TaxID=2844358 RepID=UPI001E354548|nr:MFS transporter [Radiobacillus kanasensis]UFU00196.1 MFS transporter [Radiobacillus kanasensis]